MFDTRLTKGVVFSVDAKAAADFNLDEGTQFAISRDATVVDVRASKFKDGKPSRGRPRSFATADVARMLGITDLAFPTVVADDSEPEAPTEEDESRVESLIAGTATASQESQDAPW